MNSILTRNLLVILESKSAAPLGRPNAVSALFGDHGVQVNFLPTDQYSKDKNNGRPRPKFFRRLRSIHVDYFSTVVNFVPYYLLKQL